MSAVHPMYQEKQHRRPQGQAPRSPWAAAGDGENGQFGARTPSLRACFSEGNERTGPDQQRSHFSMGTGEPEGLFHRGRHGPSTLRPPDASSIKSLGQADKEKTRAAGGLAAYGSLHDLGEAGITCRQDLGDLKRSAWSTTGAQRTVGHHRSRGCPRTDTKALLLRLPKAQAAPSHPSPVPLPERDMHTPRGLVSRAGAQVPPATPTHTHTSVPLPPSRLPPRGREETEDPGTSAFKG